MAGFADLLQRIVRDLEQAGAQRPEDDLRARLGYGPADDSEDAEGADGGDAPEAESIRGPEAEAGREPRTGWKPAVARESVVFPAPAASQAPVAAYRAPPPSPASAPHPRPSFDALLSERIRARLRTPDTLREAFVLKTLLDGPPGLRRRRQEPPRP